MPTVLTSDMWINALASDMSSSFPLFRCASCDRFRRRVQQRSGCGEELTGLQPGLEAGEDHRPAAVDLVVGVLAQLVMGDDQAARVADRLDLPGDPRGSLGLDLLAPQRRVALDEAARRIDLQVLALADRSECHGAGADVARSRGPVRGDPHPEAVPG